MLLTTISLFRGLQNNISTSTKVNKCVLLLCNFVVMSCDVSVMFAVTCVHCTCTENEVTVCLAPLKEVDYDVSAAVVPFLEEDELNDHCQYVQLSEG